MPKNNRNTNNDTGCVYLICHNETGLHKIGMTSNWERRSRELKVGTDTTKVRVVDCKNAEKWERVLHGMFKHKRIPQSEWFTISAEDAIPKMQWLANTTNQKMIIGLWKQSQAGHYYRRRRSSAGNWYTEQKTAFELQQEEFKELEIFIEKSKSKKLQEARKEPGYWPTKKNPAELEWAEKDPTYNPNLGCLISFIIIVILIFILIYIMH